MTHDPAFLRNADLSEFDHQILNYTLDEENRFIVDHLKGAPPNAVMLDVGAYKGDTSIPIARRLKREGRGDIAVVAFEPNDANCAFINDTASSEKLNLKCINTAISDDAKTLYMKRDEGSGTMYDSTFKGKGVTANTLDSFGFTNVSLLKIDVEGHEDSVLKGAHNTLAHVDKLYVEMWNDEHYTERHPGSHGGSHNKRILDEISRCLPLQKIEKNIVFRCT
tara:strand:- start:611 stop:1276 length:666 start_codon:yes stop_codon:yes gene_type:complete